MSGYTLLGVTPRLEALVREALTSSEESLRAELSLWSQSDRETISFELVQRAHKQSGCREYLHEVLMGSVVCLPEYHPPARSRKLEDRLKILQAQAQEKEYRQMVKNVDTQGSRNDVLAFGLEMSSLNRQLWTVINFVLTVVCSFVFGYFAAYFADMSTTTCVFVGLLIGGVVFLADLYFLLRSPGVSEPYQHQNRNK
ncbi:uncharacterized protein LOC135339434 [Halichondria panicea]|uniref:uncharacterized protein LOC135339434 n=1 Tax=Halichondria panicea TaxID=6063 RepID=UPI00312B9193